MLPKILHYRYKGFSLVELLIAISIISVITALGVPTYLRIVRDQELKNETVEVFSALRRTHARAQASISGTGWMFSYNEVEKEYRISSCMRGDSTDDRFEQHTGEIGNSKVKFKNAHNIYFQKNTGVLTDEVCYDNVDGQLPAIDFMEVKLLHTDSDKCSVIRVYKNGSIIYDERDELEEACA